ncbi:MAG: hypothetical protein ACRDJM_01735, partial [Actinomycetota bacterium]
MSIGTPPPARRARRPLVAAGVVLVLGGTGTVLAVRSASRSPEPSSASPNSAAPAPPACDARFREVARIGRSTSRIELSAASGDAAFFTGASPEYYTATVDARPRAGRVDASGRIQWFTFDHPEAGFQTRNSSSPAAVTSDTAWFIVDAGGRYTGESALWLAERSSITRPSIGGPIRSVGMNLVASRNGHVWSVGGAAGGYVARRESDRWVRVSGDIADFQRFEHITVD